MTNETYHYPPHIFQLFVDTIPRLCRSKRDVLTFFRGAGVNPSAFSDIENQLALDRDSVTKFDIVRTILTRLNESASDKALRDRREIVKRVVEFEDFSTCWPDDRLEAQGLVAQIRQAVNAKDSFTRMKQEREAEARKHRERQRRETEVRQQRLHELAEVRQDLYGLFTMDNAQERGRRLEMVLNRLFEAAGILVSESFARVSDLGKGITEQIDGVVELDGQVYLVEMKWLKDPVGTGDIAQHLVRVFNRGQSRGIFISYSEYTAPAIEMCKDSLSKAVIVLCTLHEFVLLVEKEEDLAEFLRAKIRGSIIGKSPLTVVS